MTHARSGYRFLVVSQLLAAAILGGASSALLGVCGPFTDVAADAFCPFVLEIFYLGITTGTTPTTYDPTASVSRLQMAAFLSRSVDGTLRRGSRRAALDQFWTTQTEAAVGLTTVGSSPEGVKCDGLDVWVGNRDSGTVSRVRAADGRLLETWTAAPGASGILSAAGRIFVTGRGLSRLYRIDPSQPAGPVTTLATNLGTFADGIAFDGTRIWTANLDGSVSIVTPGATLPWSVTTVTAGFGGPVGALFDGSNVWITDSPNGTVVKLASNGSILQSVTVGIHPVFPAFDGANIWVPNNDTPSVAVVRASTGAVLATLTGPNIGGPWAAAFDGQRVAVTENFLQGVVLFKAADFTQLGLFPAGAGTNPTGAASDGVNFWVALSATGKLARF